MENIEKPKRGGARKGAGRKPKETPKRTINVYLSEESYIKIKGLAEKEGVSLSACINSLISKL